MAIIAVLVAIAIPMFTAQLEKAREATDAANLRSAYALAAAESLSSGKATSVGPVAMTQSDEGFTTITGNIGTIAANDSSLSGAKSGVSYYVNVDTSGVMTITTTASNGDNTIPLTGKTS